MNRKLTISVPISLRPYDDGSGWIAVCPSILGAMVDGETEQEAIDGMRAYLRDRFSSDLARDGGIPGFSGEPSCFCRVRVLKVHLDAPESGSGRPEKNL